VSVILGLCAFSEINAMDYRSSVTITSLGLSKEYTSSLSSLLLNLASWLQVMNTRVYDWRHRYYESNRMEKNE